MRSLGWGPSSIGLISLLEEGETPGEGMHRGRATEETQQEGRDKSRREASGETNPAGTLILNFQIPEL